MDKELESAVALFKALGDSNRLTILNLLRNDEKCSCELLGMLDITQPTLSHHLKILSDSGVITGRKDGKNIHYSISADFFEKIIKYADMIKKNII